MFYLTTHSTHFIYGYMASLNRFVFDICYPINIFNGLNFDFVR